MSSRRWVGALIDGGGLAWAVGALVSVGLLTCCVFYLKTGGGPVGWFFDLVLAPVREASETMRGATGA